MRFVLSILGTEVIALELGGTESEDASKPDGPEQRFGFHGGSGGHVERGDGYDELPGLTADLALRAPSSDRIR